MLRTDPEMSSSCSANSRSIVFECDIYSMDTTVHVVKLTATFVACELKRV